MDTVNWKRLGDAVEFYSHWGYTYIETPWIVSEGPYKHTQPDGVQDYKTLGGYLAASGEQSFMQMMLEGNQNLGRASTCTPCFRDDVSDELHHKYFMKVELIDTNVTLDNLHSMINTAVSYFTQEIWCACRVVSTGINTYDIVGNTTGIELGSYGVRTWNKFSWIYGTGVAEPRTSQVIKLETS